MAEESEFIRAIREAPDEHSRRLVYADWLEERGDPRGEYLRLACRLSEIATRIDRAWSADVREGRYRSEVRLHSGRHIHLTRLNQFTAYSGLLEGLPTTEMNRRIIDRILVEVRNRPQAYEPYLIQPQEQPIDYQRDRPYPFGQPASMPGVACVGDFESYQPVRDSSQHGSALVVVWFQEDFAFPIGAEVWPQLLTIDWERLATDFSW